jgi:lipoic acid synthetase
MPELKKPDWIRVRLPSGDTGRFVRQSLARYGLHTVCDEAQCPNKGECWGAGTATVMILGDVCTRACRFCAVGTAREGRPLREDEGEALAAVAAELGLKYLVLTSVDRDDLADRGAGHFARCIAAVKKHIQHIQIEALVPDYTEEELSVIAADPPDVLAHNVETVRSLQQVRDARANFDKSLETLRAAKRLGMKTTKTSLLLGLGETEAEVLAAMDEIRAAQVDILVMGQYLRPSPKQIPVAEYVRPETFDFYAEEGRRRGFQALVSSPLARTSYHAREAWEAQLPEPLAAAVRIEAAGKPLGCKLIRLSAEIRGDRIASIQIRGDFFASPEEGFDTVEEALMGTPAPKLAETFDSLVKQNNMEVFGISGAGIAEVLYEGMRLAEEAESGR